MRPLARAWVFLLACFCASGCASLVPSAGPAGDKSGGGEAPTSLRLATPDVDGTPIAQLLHQFADAAKAASGGRVTVEIVFDASHGANDFEAVVIGQVRDGTADIGAVGSRAWDGQGILQLRSLQTPFLIDSYPLLDKVLASDSSARLLRTLDASGFVGLSLLPDQLRHPLGFTKPIVQTADFGGLHIRVPVSGVTDELMRALGAEPEHLNGSALGEAISDGTVTAAETSVGNATPFPARSIMTSNITFFPLVRTLFMTSSRFAALSPTVQKVVRDAAAETQAFALGRDPESADISAFCLTGGSFATAAPESVTEIIDAAQSVTADLRRDSATAALIDEITALKAEVSQPTPPTCPS